MYFGTQYCNCIVYTKSYNSFQCEIGLLLRLERLKCACIIFANPSCRLHVGHGTRRKAGKHLNSIQNNLLIPVYETRAGKSFLMSPVLIYGNEIYQQHFFVHYFKQLLKSYLSYIGSWVSFSKPASYIGFSLSLTELLLK